MNEVITFINESFQNPIKLEDMAKIMHLEVTYFSKVFKLANGISPISYINHIRIVHAMKLLNEGGSETIEGVSIMSGFRTYSNFLKTFRKHNGISPSEYRKKF